MYNFWDKNRIVFGGAFTMARLSNLIIDTDKDWLDYDITNIGQLEADKIVLGSTLNMDLGHDGSDGYIKTNLVTPSDLNIDCGTDKTIELQETVWDDLRFPLTRDKQGQNQKPDFDFTNMGLLFPQNNTTEIVYIIGQFSHSRKNGTDIKPHVHFLQDSSDEPVFKIDYRWYKNGDDPTGSFTTLTATDFVFTYTSGSIAQIVNFPTIDGSGINAVSSIIEIRLYRDDNVVSGDVLTKEFDIHYEIDTIGSRQLMAK